MTDDPTKKLADQWTDIATLMPGFGLRACAASMLASIDQGAEPTVARAAASALTRMADLAPPPRGVCPIGGAPKGAGGSKTAAPSSSGPLPRDNPEIIPEPRGTTSTDAPALDLVDSLAVIAAYRARPVSYPENFSDPVVALRCALDLLEFGTPRENVAALIRHFLRGYAERLELERLASATPAGSVQ